MLYLLVQFGNTEEEAMSMTASVRIVCTGNTEGDEVTVAAGWGKPEQVAGQGEVLRRGDVSRPFSAGSGDGAQLWLRIEGKHGDGKYLGDVGVEDMRTLQVHRLTHDELPTVGVVTEKGALLGFCLEDRPRAVKVAGDTCIPQGIYPLAWRTVGKWAGRFIGLGYPGALELENVPGFSDVLIHYGNTKRDTAGCLLFGNVCDMSLRTIGQSRKAVNRIYKRIANSGGPWQVSLYY